MITRTNPDGSTTWIPLDPGNADYRNTLVARIEGQKFKTDEAFFEALEKEALKVALESAEEQQLKEAETIATLEESSATQTSISSKLMKLGFPIEEIEMWLR